jgi:hypothetical protein
VRSLLREALLPGLGGRLGSLRCALLLLAFGVRFGSLLGQVLLLVFGGRVRSHPL